MGQSGQWRGGHGQDPQEEEGNGGTCSSILGRVAPPGFFTQIITVEVGKRVKVLPVSFLRTRWRECRIASLSLGSGTRQATAPQQVKTEHAGWMRAWASTGGKDGAFWALPHETPEKSRGHRSLGLCRRPQGSHCTYQLLALRGLVSARVLETNVSGPQSREGGSLLSFPKGRLVERKASTPKGRTDVESWQTWAWKVWKEGIRWEGRGDWQKLVRGGEEMQPRGNHCGNRRLRQNEKIHSLVSKAET